MAPWYVAVGIDCCVGVVCVGAGLFEGLFMPARGDVVVMVCS